jgi:hypothetical protein
MTKKSKTSNLTEQSPQEKSKNEAFLLPFKVTFKGIVQSLIFIVLSVAFIKTIFIDGGGLSRCVMDPAYCIKDNVNDFMAVIAAILSYAISIFMGLTIIPAFGVALIIWFLTKVVS